LCFVHPRAPGDLAPLRFLIELCAGAFIAAAARGPAASGIALHGLTAFLLLLRRLAAPLLCLGAPVMPAVLAGRLLVRRAGFAQRDSDRLARVLDLPAAAAPQLAMLEFMHDAP